ncbi:MAG: Lpg1974 family pore-forming outer membrane protein [Simkaniaceae bacterium]|nr:Lpg1974 family pore-forming outer membrane protein [Candidatus Sacchlamyda saccharinae]
MKKKSLFLGLLTLNALVGNENNDSCCETVACIGEGYTPKYYDLQCDWGVTVSAEFLYWYAVENRLPIAMRTLGFVPQGADVIPGAELAVPNKNIYMDSSWDPGFRVGAGFNSCCDGWDFLVQYTYYRNTNKKGLSEAAVQGGFFIPPGGDFLFTSPWIETFLPVPFLFDQVNAKWKLDYNVLDLEIGRKFWLSPCFNLRLFTGLKGSWIRTQYDLLQERDLATLDSTAIVGGFFLDNFKNTFRGVGLTLGLDPTWHFSRCFSLYGSADFSLLWGKYDGDRSEEFEIFVTSDRYAVSWDSTNDFYGMQGVFDLGIGLRYEDTFCCDRFRFLFDLGWEHQLWYDLIHRIKFESASVPLNLTFDRLSFATYGEIDTDLALGGLVVKAKIDF